MTLVLLATKHTTNFSLTAQGFGDSTTARLQLKIYDANAHLVIVCEFLLLQLSHSVTSNFNQKKKKRKKKNCWIFSFEYLQKVIKIV